MNKRISCVIIFTLICVSLFAAHVSSEGTYQGKHWQIWYYGSNDHRLVVDGKTILSGYFYIEKCTFDDKLYFEAVKSKEGLTKLYTINGDLAISHGFNYIMHFQDTNGVSREGVFEVTTKNGDGFECELYNADLQLVLPKYKYFWSMKDENGNIKYWHFECINGFECRLADDWKTWIGPSPTVAQRFGKIEKLSKSYYKCKKGSYWGLYNSNLKEIVAPEYEDIGLFEGTNFFKFKLNGFWGVMVVQNGTARTIIPTTRGYTSIDRYIKSQKRFTYTMYGYKGECNQLGQQVSKIKVETPQQATASSSSSSSGSSKTGTGTQTIVVEHKHDPVPVQQWQACFACGGMGTMGCDNCGGGGTTHIGNSLYRCSRCNGRGTIPCNICYGNKGQYVTVYR